MLIFGRFPLFNEAGDGDGGGGAGPGVQAPGNQPAPPVAPGSGGDAPVTRAEFNALMAKLDKLGEPPKVEPPKPDAPKGGEDMPEWAKAIHGELVELKSQRKADDIAGRKKQLADAALAGVPDANRGLAQLALDGLLASSGVKLEGDVNITQLAEQLGGQLRTQFGASLFTVPGSQFKAVPKSANGGFDWSGIHNMSEVPPEMIKHIPDDVYARLRHGGSASGVLPSGGILPRSRFH